MRHGEEPSEQGGMDAARGAWRQGVGVALATSAYGVSFGALSVAAGRRVSSAS